MPIVVATGPVLCDYGNWAAMIVSAVRKMPFLISFFVTVAGYATGEPIFTTLGWTITFTAMLMFPLKQAFNITRPDPYCPDILTWAFPSDELVYVGIVLAFAIGYSIMWKSNRTWFQWLCLGLLFLGPSIVLAVVEGEWWVYLLISLFIGVCVSLVLLWWIRTHEEAFVYLLNAWPLCVLYTDTILIHTEGHRRKYEEIRAMLTERQLARQKARDDANQLMTPVSFSLLAAQAIDSLQTPPPPKQHKKFRI